jgi:branched-chain amino acid transport system permease protein
MAGLFAMLAISLNLLLGYTGQLSLGHAAFFGIGAYTSALLDFHLGLPFWIGLPAAAVMSGLAGLLIGRLSFKVRGAYFVLVTISFAEVVRLVSLNWMDLTQGPLGLPGIKPPRIQLGSLVDIPFQGKAAYYWLVLLMAALAYLVASRVVRSRLGRAFVALRENETLAESVGIDAFRVLVLATVLAAVIAGMAGSVYAHYVSFVGPEVFMFSYTITMVIMVIAGGKGTLLGPVVGALLFTAVPELLREAQQFQMSIYGAVLILLVLFMPRGIVPTLRARRANAP